MARCHHIARWLACGAAVIWLVPAAAAQSFGDRTGLVSVSMGGGLSDAVRFWSYRGTHLSDGTSVPFGPWYSSSVPNLRMSWLTSVNDNLGVLWGFSTGERGRKYRIEPSLRLGLMALAHPSPNSTFVVSGTVVLGGRLKESACTADYGEIGGVQKVNCRMADSVLPPARTLQYLWDEPPQDRVQIQVRYVLRF